MLSCSYEESRPLGDKSQKAGCAERRKGQGQVSCVGTLGGGMWEVQVACYVQTVGYVWRIALLYRTRNAVLSRCQVQRLSR